MGCSRKVGEAKQSLFEMQDAGIREMSLQGFRIACSAGY